MAYTPTTWKSGDTVTSTKLNKLETGVKNATDTADAAIPKPASPSNGQILRWNGTAWVAANESGGGSSEVSVLTPQDTTLTLDPCPVTYKWGEVQALTLTVTATTQYHFMFSCPSASTTVLTLTGITGTAGDTIEAGKTYEVDVWAGIAYIKAVEITAVT